jgi:hypothetical protein
MGARSSPADEQKAWAAKFKKYAILAGVNEPKKSCHGVRKARAEVAAYADCTESQMMAMFGWTDPKTPAHDIAQAKREKLGISGMDKNRRVRSEPEYGRSYGPARCEQSRN